MRDDVRAAAERLLAEPFKDAANWYAASVQDVETVARAVLAEHDELARLRADRDSHQRVAARFMMALHLRHEEDWLGSGQPNQSMMDCVLCRRVGRGELAFDAAETEVERLREAAAPIMAYLRATVRSADGQGNMIEKGLEPSDRLAAVNDVWLRRSDILALEAALATRPPTAEQGAGEG